MESEDRKNQILQEATRLFSRNGYDHVTIKELADACGITEPALYRYFPSKESLYDAVLDSIPSLLKNQELFDRLEGRAELPDILFSLAEQIIEFFTKNRELYRLMLYSTLREHAKGRETFRAIRGPYVMFLIRQLDRLSAAGRIVPKNNEITARCFVGMVFDCALNSILWKGFLGRTYVPDEVITNNIPIFIQGLSTPGAMAEFGPEWMRA